MYLLVYECDKSTDDLLRVQKFRKACKAKVNDVGAYLVYLEFLFFSLLTLISQAYYFILFLCDLNNVIYLKIGIIWWVYKYAQKPDKEMNCFLILQTKGKKKPNQKTLTFFQMLKNITFSSMAPISKAFKRQVFQLVKCILHLTDILIFNYHLFQKIKLG